MTVFKEKESESLISLKILDIMNLRPTKGDVGIEIEVEGKNVPDFDTIVTTESTKKRWLHTIDHSLRGAENAEYIFRGPKPFDEVDECLDALWDLFKAKKTVIDDSSRTSVHVHLNVQDWYLDRLASFLALYYPLEDILTEWCGDHREGNLFCLRAKDAPAIIKETRSFFKNLGSYPLDNNLHYAGCSLSSLSKFGSVEFRTLRGTDDPQIIKDWVNILRRLYDMSAKFEDPREVCQMFSAVGPAQFFSNVLGPLAQKVLNDTGKTVEDLQSSLYTGMRFAQDICYSLDWKKMEKVDITPDPFGRKQNKRTVINKLMSRTQEKAAPPAPPLCAVFPNQTSGGLASFTIDETEFYEEEPEYFDD